ncbi:MAG: CDP-diacylglycerol--glycerol-3-phosphate 3-phosphatidyltransferase [Kiritimatiellia bacterium]|nr:CDP-diacylglycerol--glycerol-3-phosphate 3-phosphatidyltransferase [Lentisphaerota bacterium]
MMNLANKLTLSRLVLAMIMTVCLTLPIPFGKTAALFIFLLAALTDYWDGRLARQHCGSTTFGKLMDPLADKILICSAFICFAAIRQVVPALIVVIIISREFMVTGLRLLAAGQGKIISAERWGKHKTIWQIIVISLIILGLAIRGEILPLFMEGARLDEFRQIYLDPWFRCAIFIIASLVTVLTVVSGSIYFWKCRDMVFKDA